MGRKFYQDEEQSDEHVSSNQDWWVQKTDTNFDETMGCLDGAESCELVGLFHLLKLDPIINKIHIFKEVGLRVTKTLNVQVSKIFISTLQQNPTNLTKKKTLRLLL